MRNWNGHTQQLAKSPYLFCDCGEIRKGSRKGQVEATRTASTYKKSKPKVTLHSGGIVEITGTIQGLKVAEMVINSSVWPVQKTGVLGE